MSMDVNPSSRVHTTDDIYGAGPTDRLLRTSDNADDEDRVISPVLATATAKALPAVRQVSKTGEKVLSTLKRLPQNGGKTIDVLRQASDKIPTAQSLRSEYNPEVQNALKVSDAIAINHFKEDEPGIVEELNLSLVSSNKEVRQKALQKLFRKAELHENERLATSAAKLFENMKHLINRGVPIEEVILGLELEKEGANIFATPKVELLKLIVKAHNEKQHASLSLLDAFVIGLGSEGEVARTLELSLLGRVHGDTAMKLEAELFKRWLLTDKKSPDDVVATLVHEGSGTESITETDAFIVYLYIRHFNSAYPKSETDVVTCLRKYVNERDLAIWIAEMEVPFKEFFAEFKPLMRPWLKANEAPEDLYARVFEPVAVDEVYHVNRIISVYQERFKAQNELAEKLGLAHPTTARQP
ncbi:unnamed protein product [Hyaloperonospora brassicae]|uniref:RxLR effector candidate protein n=1 Tax=Hyaloperonospora brassicae TaxID=162125 RepID=A0AAV0THC3_HYABA|nr:unnamed protein product [Hyaloperonospora brassicae]